MSIFGKDIDEKVSTMTNEWIKAEEFTKAPSFKFRGVEKVKSQYGGKEENSIVEKGILEIGETFRYLFEDVEGNQRKHDSTSFPLFIAMQEAEINEGDWLKISKEGVTTKTRYYVEVVEEPKVSQAKPAPKHEFPDNVDPDSIPF